MPNEVAKIGNRNFYAIAKTLTISKKNLNEKKTSDIKLIH